MNTPKAPKQTSAQKAFDIEQKKALNEETIDENRRRKALVRGTLGAKSLLDGTPIQTTTSGGEPILGTAKRVKSGVK